MPYLWEDTHESPEESLQDITDHYLATLGSTYAGCLPIRFIMNKIRKATSNLEDDVKLLTSTLVSFYFPLSDNWVIGPEYSFETGAGRPDFCLFKTPSSPNSTLTPYTDDILEHCLIECKARGVGMVSTLGQPTGYAESTPTTNRSFVIAICGNLRPRGATFLRLLWHQTISHCSNSRRR